MGTVVKVQDESYATKGCTKCGFQNNKVGGAKVYACPSCSVRVDRDYASGRNILLKNEAESAASA